MNWSRIPSLPALRALESAVRHQSLSKAAAELNVTHAAIAQHVRMLEADFSTSLLVRAGRGVVGTVDGKKLAAGLNAGFSSISDAVEDLRRQSDGRPLNVTVTPAFAASWLMPKIGDFWSKHPDISINLNPAIQLVDLRSDGFDLGLRYGSGDWSGVESELLVGSEFWVVAPPALVKPEAVSCLSDLEDLPWLMEDHMMELQHAIAKEGLDLNSVDLKRMATNALVISGVKSGLGITAQPKSLVEGDVARGELVKLCELEEQGLGYYMVSLPGRAPNGLREFKKWLRSWA